MVKLQMNDTFGTVIQFIIVFSVFTLFMAIVIDFALFSKRDDVQKVKNSFVETGTMTLFFVFFYLILRSKMGVIEIDSNIIKRAAIIIGTIAIVAGCVINITGRFNLGRNWANQITIYNQQTLVQHGVYKIVRHPLYASIMLMFYGACLVFRNVVSFLAVTVIFIPFMYYRAKQEEKLLSQRFEEYDLYKKRTGMFFPKLIRRREG